MSNITLTLSVEDPAIARQIIDLVGGGNPVQEIKQQMVAQAPIPQYAPYTPAPAATVPTAPVTFSPTSPSVPTAPVNPPMAAPIPTQQPMGAVNTQPVATSAPIPSAPMATPSNSVPVAPAPTFTVDDLSRAASSLVDSGKQPQVLALLGQFGIQAMPQLPKERYGEFATALRQLGARI